MTRAASRTILAMTPLLNPSVHGTTLLPFSLWTTRSQEASLLTKADLPNLRTWLAAAQRVEVQVDPSPASLLATLSPPHERAWAQAVGWPEVDGALPWAAQAAVEKQLANTADTASTAWALITLCNWQVSHGQVTLGDPAHLQIDAAEDALLFQAMQAFFADDGITLHPYKPGQWLAQSPLFVDLPTASLDRVIGRNIDPWLVGCESATNALSPAAKLLRRLQNEMQMLLYTHAVNEGRSLTINSFWVHGTGALAPLKRVAPQVVYTLRTPALQQDFIGWLDAWQRIDADVVAPLLARVAAGEAQRLVLCGEHEFHVFDSATPSLWQRVRTHFAPTTFDTVLAVAPLKD